MQHGKGPSERSGSRRLRLPIAAMVVGAAVAIPSGIVAGVSVKDALKIEAAGTVPGSFDVHLASGEWEIYQLTGTASGSSVGPFSYTKQTGGPVTIDSTDVTVNDAEGGVVVPRERFSPSSFQTYTTGSDIYTGVASFDVKSVGSYHISITDTQPGQVIVSRPPLAVLSRVLGWIIAGVGAAVVFVVGLFVLILRLDRRRRAALLLPTSGISGQGVAPAQNFAAPSGRCSLRYWDGVAWTEDTNTAGTISTDPL